MGGAKKDADPRNSVALNEVFLFVDLLIVCNGRRWLPLRLQQKQTAMRRD